MAFFSGIRIIRILRWDTLIQYFHIFLQKNNAMAVVDLNKKRITDLVPLGYKNHNVTGQGFDPSDMDGGMQWSSFVRTAKALTRLRGCAGSPEPSQVAHVISTIIS